jgi:hypothetical protein
MKNKIIFLMFFLFILVGCFPVKLDENYTREEKQKKPKKCYQRLDEVLEQWQ